MTMTADTHHDGAEQGLPIDARVRLDQAAALMAWASRGYPADRPVETIRARATLDLHLPSGVMSLQAMKLLDLMLAFAYAAGPKAPAVRVALPDLAAFLAGAKGGRPLRPGEVMKVIEEIAATAIVWNATGADREAPTIVCPAIERVEYDGLRWLTYAIPKPIRPAVVAPMPFVRVNLGDVHACTRGYGVRLVHLSALHAPGADRNGNDIIIEFSADELAAAIGYKRSPIRPAQLLEAIKGAMADVPALGNGRRLGFLRPYDLDDSDLDGKPRQTDPRLIKMYVFTANPKPAPWPPKDFYTGPGYARETPEGRRRIEEIEFKEAIIRRVVDAECDGLTEAEIDALKPQWLREAAEEVRADLAEVDRRHRAREAERGDRPVEEQGSPLLGGWKTLRNW